jgi:hypothetical protein
MAKKTTTDDLDFGTDDRKASDLDFGTDDTPAAKAALPKGVTPSSAGGGRGSINRTLPTEPEPSTDPMGGDLASTIANAGTRTTDTRSLLERSVEDAPYDRAQLERQERRGAGNRAQASAPPMSAEPYRETPKRGLVRAASDAALGVYQGAAGMVEGAARVVPIVGAPVADFFDTASKGADRLKSPELREQTSVRQGRIDSVKNSQGEMAAARAAFQSVFDLPAAGLDVVAQGAGSLVPTLALGSAGVSPKAIEVLNALSTAGDAKKSTEQKLREVDPAAWRNDSTYQALRSSGLDHEQALGIIVPIYSIPAQAAGALAGAISGKLGVEQTFANRASGAVRRDAFGDRVARVGAEHLGEQGETWLPGLAQNAVVGAVDNKTGLTEGMGQQTADTFTGTLGPGALAARSHAHAPGALAPEQATTPPAPPVSSAVGPDSSVPGASAPQVDTSQLTTPAAPAPVSSIPAVPPVPPVPVKPPKAFARAAARVGADTAPVPLNKTPEERQDVEDRIRSIEQSEADTAAMDAALVNDAPAAEQPLDFIPEGDLKATPEDLTKSKERDARQPTPIEPEADMGIPMSEAPAPAPAPAPASKELIDQAREIVTKSGRASVSAVQRHLKIGYTNAQRLMEQLEAEGVVSPMTAAGAREVLAKPKSETQSATTATPEAQSATVEGDSQRPPTAATAGAAPEAAPRAPDRAGPAAAPGSNAAEAGDNAGGSGASDAAAVRGAGREGAPAEDGAGADRPAATRYPDLKAANDYIREQKGRGTSVIAAPFTHDDGTVSVAIKGSKEYDQALDQRQARVTREANAKLGIEPDDVLNAVGKPFTTRSGAKKAVEARGAGHEIVRLDSGGYVVRKAAEQGVSDATVASGSDGNNVRGTDASGVRGGSADGDGSVGPGLGGPGGELGTGRAAVGTDRGSKAAPVPAGDGPDAALKAGWTRMVTSDRLSALEKTGRTGLRAKMLSAKAWDDLQPRTREALAKAIGEPNASTVEPKSTTPAASIDAAAHEAATSPTNDLPEPTQAQKEAGNYKMGHLSGEQTQGVDITVENPKGSERKGVSPDGTEWSNTMGAHYGYAKRSLAADGDHVDMFVGPAADRAPNVWVIDQVNKDGTYDEAKALFGFMNKAAGVRAYKASYMKGWKVGPITEMTVAEFKNGLENGLFKKPLDPSLATPAAPAPAPAPVAAAEPATAPAAAPSTPKPKRETKAVKAAREAEEARAKYFTPGNVVRGYAGFDRVISYHPPADADGRWSVTVQEVEEKDGKWVDSERSLERTHTTQPTAANLRTGPRAKVATPTLNSEMQRSADRKAAMEAEKPKPNGDTFPGFFHGTAVPMEAFEVGRGGGAGYHHQGPAVYLTDDRQGLARFFAGAAAIKIGRRDKTMTEAQQDAVIESGGTVLNVDVAPDARILDMRGDNVPADVKDLFDRSTDDRALGEQLRDRVLALGYDGIAFKEPNRPEGWEVKPDAVTLAIYRPEKALIKGNEPAAPPKAAAPAEAPAKPPKGKAAAAPAIADFGEELKGAKKMLYTDDYKAKMAEASKADIKTEPLSKSWPAPDYQKLIEGGADSAAVAFARAARDQVPNKPTKGWKLNAWAEKVKTLRESAEAALAGTFDVRDRLKGPDLHVALNDWVVNQTMLYEAVGHAHSLKDVELSAGHYSMYGGVKYSPSKTIWSVSRSSKGSFGNWGKELGVGDTREEAIAKFKANYDKAFGQAAEAAQKKGASFDIYSDRRGNAAAPIFIGKKIGGDVVRLKTGFKTVAEAREWRAGNQAALETSWSDYKHIPSERKAENAPRVGQDHRNSGDVTPEQFGEAFGFRGVQFGNYVEGPRRQADLNRAYDSLMDMAAVLGVPPRSLSLDGKLGLAFGARGSGGKDAAAAHYEPGQVVINLTKNAGAGSLAHEWWHALDNYFGKKDGSGRYLSATPDGVGDVRPQMRAAFAQIKRTLANIPMTARSKALDKRRSKPYWSTEHELSARAFESYVIAKLNDQNFSNDYLANVVPSMEWVLNEEPSYPYPLADELPAVREAFDKFFDTIESRETDRGTTELFSAADPMRTAEGAGAAVQTKPASAEHDRKAARLLDNLKASQEGFISFQAVEPNDSTDAGKSLAAVRLAAKRLFGHDVVFVRFNGPAVFNGAMSASVPGTVFIRVDSSKPHLAILGHELLHSLRREAPHLYAAMEHRLNQLTNDKTTDFYRDLKAKYDAIGREAPEGSKLREELYADIVGDNFVSPEFWAGLAADNRGLFRRVADAVVRFLDRIIAKLANTSPLGTDALLKDVQEARRVVIAGMRAFSEQARSRTGLATAAGESMSAATQKQTDTPAFKRWFGDSKVVDDSGAPAVVYHGTIVRDGAKAPGMGDITAFDRMFTTKFRAPSLDTVGSWFSTNPGEGGAAMYSGNHEGSAIYPVYLAIKNPQVTTFQLLQRRARLLQNGKDDGRTIGTAEVDAYRKWLTDMGKDGIKIEASGNEGSTEFDNQAAWIALEPSQIKSATGNGGAFDPSSADIRLSAAAPAPSQQPKPNLAKAIFGGSIAWTRDQSGKPVKLAEQKKAYEAIGTDERAEMLLRTGTITADQLKRWRESKLDIYEGAINNRFRKQFESPGLVWRDDELRRLFKMDDAGIAEYRQLRASADSAITAQALDDMLRVADRTGQAINEEVKTLPLDLAAERLRDELLQVAEGHTTEGEGGTPRTSAEGRKAIERANKIIDILDVANDRMGHGHVPTDVAAEVIDRPWAAPGRSRIDNLIYEWQDGKVDLKRVQEAIERDTQDQIEDQFNARLAETLYAGRVAKKSEDFVKHEVEPLLKAMRDAGVDQVELGDYLHARAAPERNKQIAKINPLMPDGGAGSNSKGLLLTTAAANKYLADIPADRRAVLDRMGAMIDKITAGTRARLVLDGLEDGDTIAAWEGAYKHYVPMFREDVDFNRLVIHKRATGSEKQAINIVAQVLQQREAAIVRGEKNRIAVALYGLALSNPNPSFWATIRPDSQAEDIKADLERMGIDPLVAEAGHQGLPSVTDVDPVTNRVTTKTNPMYAMMPGAITLKIKGESRVLMLNVEDERAKRMAAAMKGADSLLNDYDVAGSIVGRATRWLAAVNTQYNPAFGIVNFWRDTSGGLVHLTNTELRHEKLRVMAGIPGAMRGIFHHLTGREDAGKWSRLFDQFMAEGGKTGFTAMFENGEKRAKEVERQLKIMSRGPMDPRRVGRMLINLLSGFNDIMENAVRLSAYAAALDKGMSKPQAARLGRELTVDFNRKGRTGRTVGPLYAFFNAALQGTERTMRALRGPAGPRIIAGGFALGVLQGLMLAAAGFDDDDLPEFVKARALIIPLPGEGKRYIAIPLPLGLHVLPNTGRVLTEMALSELQPKKLGLKAWSALGEIAGAFNPLGGGNVFTTDGALKTVLPTVLDPLVELASNRNFAGVPIEQQERGDRDPRPGAARTREATRRTLTGQAYLGISKAINAMTPNADLDFGTDVTQGGISWTPERYRYIAQVLGGGVLRETERLINLSAAKLAGQEVPENSIPVMNRWYGKVDDQQVQRSKYFNNVNKLEKLEGEIKAAKAADLPDLMDRLQAKPEADAIRFGNRAQRAVNKLTKEVKETTDPARLKELDAERYVWQKDLNESIEQEEKARRKPTLGERVRASAAGR